MPSNPDPQTPIPGSDELSRLHEANARLDNAAKLLVRRDLELNRANDKLRELDQKKSEFVSLVTHQLRTPLSGSKWSLSMILNGDLGPLTPDQRLYLMKTYESNERMIRLINDLLSADRIESGTVEFNLMPTQLRDLIDNVVNEIKPIADGKNVTIETHYPPEVPLVAIDPATMRVVLQNLIENGIKYNMPKGRVDITLTPKEKTVECSIADTGIGIPKEAQDRVFQRFFRAPNAVKAETDGSGLGLYIVANVIKKHDGAISFTSEVNKGTTFTVSVPIIQINKTV